MADMLAQPQDVADRWRPLTGEESRVAVTLLLDASDIVRTRWPDVDSRIAAGTLRQASVVRVVANMVKRAMVASAVAGAGVSQMSESVGPFQSALTFANPNGNLYLSAEEVRLFDGVAAGHRAFSVDLAQSRRPSWFS